MFRPVLVLMLMAAGLQVLGCKPPAATAKKMAPASVSKINGTNLVRLTLLPEAAKRLDIQTAPVRDETIVAKRKVAGEVATIRSDNNAAIVQVNLTESEQKLVRRAEPAFILPLAHQSKALPIKALPIKQPPGLGGLPGSLFYEVSGNNHGLVRRQLVFVEISLAGNGQGRKIVPYAAVLYDPKGNTWVYTNPQPLVFIRQPIYIETIRGNEVILSGGPPAGTAVVTVGGAELYGTEFGVGK